MKNYNRIIWGVLLLALGVVLAMNALNITDINIFFDGWWTLFIIVPCTVGLLKRKDPTGNLTGLLIGIYLLLCCLDIIDFSFGFKLIIPALIIIFGCKMIFGGISHKRSEKVLDKLKNKKSNTQIGCGAFSSFNMDCSGENFEGTELVATFGAVKCDLRNAVITEDCLITFTAVFGGIDILVPKGVNIKVNSTSIFGGVDNKIKPSNGAPTIYVSGLCMFGGVDIK